MINIKIKDSITSNIADVSETSALKIIPNNEGFMMCTSAIDLGESLGYSLTRDLEASNDYRLRIGYDNIMFNEVFASTTLNTSVWTTPATTMTAVIAAGWMVLNSGNSIATTVNVHLRSYKCFPMIGSFGTYLDAKVLLVQRPVTNNVIEIGLGIASGATAPTDGAFFRINAQGEFRCVVVYNSVEAQSPPIDFNLIGTGVARHFRMNIEEDTVNFWIDDVKVAEIQRHKAAASITNSNAAPFFARIYNLTAVSVAQQLKIGQVSISMADANFGKPWSHVMSGTGLMCYQGASGMTVGQTAQLAITANPTAAAPTTTTAALGSGLGGVFLANITGLAITTDYIISSYQVVADTATVPGRNLYITGIKFNAVNAGAANAAAIMSWVVGMNFGLTAVSEATTESATTKAPRRVYLGAQTLPASAAIGIPASPEIVVDFSYAPITVQQGQFVQTFLRFTNYTSTTSQALWCYVTFIGYWE